MAKLLRGASRDEAGPPATGLLGLMARRGVHRGGRASRPTRQLVPGSRSGLLSLDDAPGCSADLVGALADQVRVRASYLPLAVAQVVGGRREAGTGRDHDAMQSSGATRSAAVLTPPPAQ